MAGEDVRALIDINLEIREGEYIAIMGPSGSGKSTLMNILGCLDTPTTGTYELRGQPVHELDDDALAHIRNQEIGFVFQTFNLLPRASALRNIELPLIYSRIPGAERNRLARQALEAVGLMGRAEHKPNELSGGQKQRVAIARALVTEPGIILADEPTGNLDSRTGEEILQLFDKIHQQGKTVILVTHEESVALRTRRILRILDGRIEKDEMVSSTGVIVTP
ncbi:MAG: ABC transporter ATP-binding protein [Candidatus Eisenbacteria bacterium]|uniref:ABC transporter ATP-binding protein n=1 Tax=Eiseniibacteriota bacterium TaxID=2212470 RepID=A0A948W5S6_UNCEI|nr:ABC transporter ATP-binding protein [Candidatus Eisenbacteria bacterium]MBU1947852.1 ABC transporter ATP-binding protein [Candidatus Eisenbacteria bacterium]MBU2690340.1 ABC transporter ATP-binding protein [Candidatus Eisenbacteria bacterium]